MFLYFKLNLASAMEYRVSFLTQAIGMAINNSSFIFFWWVAFGQIGENIAGYTFRDVMMIWALASGAFGLAHALFGNINRITQLVVTGEMDTYLTQPKDPLVSMICARTNFSSWGDVLYAVILFAVSGQGWGTLPIFIMGLVLGTLMITAITITAHTLTFYFGDMSLAGGMVTEFIINFSLYPIGIYPQVLRFLMYTILPAAFISHVPLALARSFDVKLLLILIGATLVYCAFAWWFFHRGMRRYESGNVIVTRL